MFLLLVFTAFASTAMAAQLTPIMRTALRPSAISTVAQLKALKSQAKQTKVMKGQLNLNLAPQLRTSLNLSAIASSPLSAASTAYKTGTGVVLKPSAMNDPTTGSELHLFGATMDQKLVDQVLTKSDAPIPMMCPAGQHGNFGFLIGYFRNLPKGNHLYMLTIRMSVAADRANYLQFLAGSSGINRSTIMNLGDDYMALLTFDTAGGDGSMQVMAKFSMPMDDAIAFPNFSYLQLAQVD
jgi:hypothetical protein